MHCVAINSHSRVAEANTTLSYSYDKVLAHDDLRQFVTRTTVQSSANELASQSQEQPNLEMA